MALWLRKALTILFMFGFITFAWDWTGDPTQISGFRLYKVLKTNPASKIVLVNHIDPHLRVYTVDVPDSEVYKYVFTATAYNSVTESEYSNSVGVKPRKPTGTVLAH